MDETFQQCGKQSVGVRCCDFYDNIPRHGSELLVSVFIAEHLRGDRIPVNVLEK